MPKFKYTGDVERIFPGDGTRDAIVVAPGDVIEASENIDPVFFAALGSDKKVKERNDA